jgi:hypothetical protein
MSGLNSLLYSLYQSCVKNTDHLQGRNDSMANAALLTKRHDGKYEERLDETWVAEYFEVPENGLWRVEVFNHDVSKWVEEGFASLEEAQQAAHNFWDQV